MAGTVALTFTNKVGINARRIRQERFRNVDELCEKSVKLARRKKIRKPMTIARWYRFEQGSHPRMVADTLEDAATILGCSQEELIG